MTEMSSTFEKLKENKLARMRQGQNAASIESIPSDPEIRIALVPLLEGEYNECMKASAALAVPDNIPGAQIADREEKRNVIFRSAREVDNYEKAAFPSVNDMMVVLDPGDINHLYDCYVEMVQQFSPRVASLSQDDIDFLSELFGNLAWNDLSGKQVYALSRFLSSLQPAQLTGNLPGHLSIR